MRKRENELKRLGIVEDFDVWGGLCNPLYCVSFTFVILFGIFMICADMVLVLEH